MQWRRFLGCVATTGWLLLWCCVGQSQEVAPKKRVAVLNFDNPNFGSDTPSGLFGAAGEDVGKGVSAQLIQKLVAGGRFTLVDRSALEKALKEQNDADSDRLDAYEMAARVGRMLSLDAMIIGAVTRYGPDEKHKAAGGGVFSTGMHTRKSKAYVEITARVLDISSGKILAGFTGAGESVRSGEITTVSRGGHSKSSLEILGSEFVESLLVEATSNAVDQIAVQLNLFADKIPAPRIAMDVLVAEVSGNTLTLNAGRKSGLQVGEQVEILRDRPAVGGAANSGIFPRVAAHIGLATVTEVADDYATATFSGSGQVQVGDHVKAKELSRDLPH
jgi:curli biogenesis system outer membrane secretion channel CsgG